MENGEAAYTFKPTVPGKYTITAAQGATAPYTLTTEVKQGINLDVGPDTGSLEIVSPLQAACLVIG
ncbi:hypothetical protein EEB19_22905 [Gordonia sp. OPL2]|nr:hypothetical protein EEB19_22905 [Gordonia sp. OPL2]